MFGKSKHVDDLRVGDRIQVVESFIHSRIQYRNRKGQVLAVTKQKAHIVFLSDDKHKHVTFWIPRTKVIKVR